VFHPDLLSHQVLSIEIINSVISITIVLKFDKPITLFDEDVSQVTVAFEESLEVLFSAA